MSARGRRRRSADLMLACWLALAGCGERHERCQDASVAETKTNRIRGDASPFASVELPLVGGGEDPSTQLWIDLTADGRVTLNGATLRAPTELLPRARAAREQNVQLRAWIRADASVPYGALWVVIDLLKQAGISRMAFSAKAPVAP